MQLGDYDLMEPIAAGGFAAVWRARHRATGVRAAVKLLPPSPALHASFANEVRAVGSLDHEHIVTLLDYGMLRRPLHDLAPGTAWMAMEHCAEPLRRTSVRSWPDLRGVLEPLLHALAHAHARGVLHRDIKIDNVLFAGPGDHRPGLKLVDFGIAARIGRGTDAAGTPRYGAPEQMAGRWWDLGPWTDLYALGVLAYRLAIQTRPWPGLHDDALLVAMQQTPIGWGAARFPLPGGLQQWVARCTAKAIDERFPHAAAALSALRTLEGPEAADTLIGDHAEEERPTDRTTRTVHWSGRPADLLLRSAGLALLQIRRPPLFGRERELARLEARLGRTLARQTHDEQVIEAPSGWGSTRLLQALAESTALQGRADPLSVEPRVNESLEEAVVRALRWRLRCGEREGEALIAHLASWGLADDLTAACARLLEGEVDHAWARLAARLLTLWPRPQLVLLDTPEQDIQPLLQALRATPGPARLVVAVQRPTPEGGTLPPLETGALTRLAAWLGGLQPADAGRIAAGAQTPKQVVALLSTAVQRDLIRPGVDGATVAEDATLWGIEEGEEARRRLTDDDEALEAAVEGLVAWGGPCRPAQLARIGVDAAAIERLGMRLAYAGLGGHQGGLIFLQSPALGAHIEARAAGTERWIRTQLAFAAARSPIDPRRGWHLLQAQCPDEAVDTFAEALVHRLRHVGGRQLTRWIPELRRIAQTSDRPATIERAIALELRLAAAAEANDRVDALAPQAQTFDDPLARCIAQTGICIRHLQRHDTRALRAARLAVENAPEHGLFTLVALVSLAKAETFAGLRNDATFERIVALADDDAPIAIWALASLDRSEEVVARAAHYVPTSIRGRYAGFAIGHAYARLGRLGPAMDWSMNAMAAGLTLGDLGPFSVAGLAVIALRAGRATEAVEPVRAYYAELSEEQRSDPRMLTLHLTAVPLFLTCGDERRARHHLSLLERIDRTLLPEEADEALPPWAQMLEELDDRGFAARLANEVLRVVPEGGSDEVRAAIAAHAEATPG